VNQKVISLLTTRTVAAALILSTAFTATACSQTPPHTKTSCPDAPLVSSIYLDVTGSHYTDLLADEYSTAVGSIAARTAACSGHLRVATFGETSGRVETIVDQPLQVDAPTKNAVQRKQQKLAADIADTVKNTLAEAASRTPVTGTDVVGLLRLAAESQSQQPEAFHEVFVFTDGFTNVGVDPAAAPDVESAVALALEVSVPDLSGSALTFAGIGRTASPQSSVVVEQVVTFWKQVCERTQALSCTVVTQWHGVRS